MASSEPAAADIAAPGPDRIRLKLVAAGALIALAAAGAPLAVKAQELEPRAYVPSPVGLNLVVTTLSSTRGDVVFDAGSLFSNVHAKIDVAGLGLGRVFDLGGRQASVVVVAPYATGDVTGDVGEEARAVSRTGIGDLRIRLAAILLGAPAMTPKAFAASTPQTTLGASLTVVAPTGQYDSTKLVNIGTHRWALKPEIALTVPRGRWDFDAYAAIAVFQDNPDFFGGHVRHQDPIASLQGHVSYTFRPRLWVALDATYYTGGVTTVAGLRNDDRQDNARVGATLSVPFGKQQSLKFSYSDGAITRIGGKFTQFGVAWQYAWLGR